MVHSLFVITLLSKRVKSGMGIHADI